MKERDVPANGKEKAPMQETQKTRKYLNLFFVWKGRAPFPFQFAPAKSPFPVMVVDDDDKQMTIIVVQLINVITVPWNRLFGRVGSDGRETSHLILDGSSEHDKANNKSSICMSKKENLFVFRAKKKKRKNDTWLHSVTIESLILCDTIQSFIVCDTLHRSTAIIAEKDVE